MREVTKGPSWTSPVPGGWRDVPLLGYPWHTQPLTPPSPTLSSKVQAPHSSAASKTAKLEVKVPMWNTLVSAAAHLALAIAVDAALNASFDVKE